MKKEKYIEKARKLEQQASQSPGWFRFKLGFLTSLGFAYIFLFLALFLAITFGLIYLIAFEGESISYGKIKGIILFGFVSYLIIKALFTRIPLPSGTIMEKKDAPELFDIIEEVRQTLQVPPIDLVLLDHQYNAGARIQYKFLLPVAKQRILVIGMPMLISLSPQEMKAILAHELAHLSTANSSLLSRAEQVLFSWEMLLYQMEKEKEWTRFLFKWFFQWYGPLLDTYITVLRRKFEYEADQGSVKAAGVPVTGEALVRGHVMGTFYESVFLPSHFEQAEKEGCTPAPLQTFAKIAKEIPEELQQKILSEILKEEETLDDYHPTLEKRLKAIGWEAKLPSKLEQTAAEAWLKHLDRWIVAVENVWGYGIDGMVANVGEAIEESIEMEKEWEALKAKEGKTVKEYFRYARLTYEIEGPKKALAVFREITDQFADLPDPHAQAYYHMGEMYLEMGDEENARKMMEKAMEVNWKIREMCLETLIEYYEERHKETEDEKEEKRIEKILDELDQRLVDWRETLERSDEEVEDYDNDDKLAEHDLSEETVRRILRDCAQRPEIVEIYIARKQLIWIPERKCYVFGFVLRYPPNVKKEKFADQFLKWYRSVENWVPGESELAVILNDEPEYRKKIEGVQGSLIFSKEKMSV